MKRCKECGLCVEVCPFKVIECPKGSPAAFNPERLSLCLKCGQCMAICPTRFIEVDGLSYDENFEEIQNTDFTDFLASRRSVRNFSDRDVPDEVIQEVLDVLRFAPFGSHREKISMTVVTDRKKIESALPLISGLLNKITRMIENPLISFFFKRFSSPELFNTVKNHLYPISKEGIFNLEEGDSITRGAPVLILFHSNKGAEARTANSLINATYAMLQAHALGLGSTMVEVVPAAINQVKELKSHFNIPTEHEVSMSLVMGYPRYKYKRSIWRPSQAVNWI